MKKLTSWLAVVVLSLSLPAFGQVFTTQDLQINGNRTQPQQTVATSGANQSSNNTSISGNYWTGAASASDTWNLQNVLGAGSNPASTLTFSHSGSPGSAFVSMPLGYLQGATGSATRSVTSRLQDTASVLDFPGCDPTNTNDSTTCLQTAFNAMSNGSVMRIPPGTYKVTSTLTIGNGSASAPSTVNGLHIIGVGSGIASNEYTTNQGTVVLKWAGASGGTMMQINGPIWGTSIEGIVLNANSLARSCLVLNHPIGGLFQNLECTGYTGPAFDHEAYAEPVGAVVGSSDNIFMNVMAKAPATGGDGIIIGAAAMGTTKQLDVARNIYMNDHWDFDGQTPTSYGMLMRFTDNNTFIENTTARANGGTGGFGLQINPPTGTGGTAFPGNLQFYNSPILGNVFVPGSASWNGNPGIGFWPYPAGDGEVIPVGNHPGNIYGVTDSGLFFGTAGGVPVYNAAGTASYSAHTVVGTIAMSAGTINVTFSGAAAFTSNATYACTGTNESSASAVQIVMNSGSSITINGTGSGFVNYICTGN